VVRPLQFAGFGSAPRRTRSLTEFVPRPCRPDWVFEAPIKLEDGEKMGANFEELDWQQTPMGTISLRRRRDPSLGADIFEAKLGDEFLMSSQFTAAEIALARLGLAELSGDNLDVIVGGLGLGYTTLAVLEDSRVRSLIVIEALPAVIDWHKQRLLPVSDRLMSDPRCRVIPGDFFAMIGDSSNGLDKDGRDRRFHAILVDIDHTPRNVLHASHAPFYQPPGLRNLADHLCSDGVFGLWSNDPPDVDFGANLAEVFATSRADVVYFPNHLQGGESSNTVYVATKGA
jgi:spermidine synthase